ncbi:universal stress protein [Methylocystis sp. ATCC 49242]|uniref:universal stress protein n=1 Tax=Methylocystis sp. ATCC 49242 TaxID=622637 RepID=UPI0001F87832|nr:universal stress protein [Methylocystis sp. ATCC 49242]
MSQKKHIVAATDFSQHSAEAVERGFMIASQWSARYTILHAVELDALSLFQALFAENPDLGEKLAAVERNRLREFICALPHPEGVHAELRVESGPASVAIPDFLSSAGGDLLVIGAHGGGFFDRLVPGSTASALLRESRGPVLIVRNKPREPYRRVLVAVDFSPASESAVALARDIAPEASLTLIHIFDAPFEGMLRLAGVDDWKIASYEMEAKRQAGQKLESLMRGQGLTPAQCSTVVIQGDPTRQLLRYEENLGCDLIIVGKHGTHLSEELLLGSKTNHLLAMSRRDLLVVVDPRGPAAPEGI